MDLRLLDSQQRATAAVARLRRCHTYHREQELLHRVLGGRHGSVLAAEDIAE